MYDSVVELNDRELIEAYLAGNEAAWQLLTIRHERSLFFYIRNRLRAAHSPVHDCEDTLQETWLALLQNGCQRLHCHLQRQGCFAAFLRAVAGQCIQLARRREGRRVQPVPLNGHELPDAGADRGLAHAKLTELRDSLARQQRRCLCEKLMREESVQDPPLSEDNARQLKYRIEEKLDKHF
jgi:DNA-directed RNA polymerase specialized sigma24 family protein